MIIRRRNRFFPQVVEIIEAAMERPLPRQATQAAALPAPDEVRDRYSEAQVRRNQECAKIFGQAAAKVIDYTEATRRIENRLAAPLESCEPDGIELAEIKGR